MDTQVVIQVPQSGIVGWQHSSCNLHAAVATAAQRTGSPVRKQLKTQEPAFRRSRLLTSKVSGSREEGRSTRLQPPSSGSKHQAGSGAGFSAEQRHVSEEEKGSVFGATHGASLGGRTLSRSRASSLIASRMWFESRSSFLTRMACHTSEQEAGMGTSTQRALGRVAWWSAVHGVQNSSSIVNIECQGQQCSACRGTTAQQLTSLWSALSACFQCCRL